MEGGAIADAQLSASSVYYGFLGLQRWGPELARLNNQGIVNAWTSSNYDKNPWIQVPAFWRAPWCVLGGGCELMGQWASSLGHSWRQDGGPIRKLLFPAVDPS